MRGIRKSIHFDRRDLKDLISALVDVHFKYQEIIFSPGDILKHFDNLFKSVAAFVRLVGVKDSGDQGIKKVRKSGEKGVSRSLSRQIPL